VPGTVPGPSRSPCSRLRVGPKQADQHIRKEARTEQRDKSNSRSLLVMVDGSRYQHSRAGFVTIPLRRPYLPPLGGRRLSPAKGRGFSFRSLPFFLVLKLRHAVSFFSLKTAIRTLPKISDDADTPPGGGKNEPRTDVLRGRF